MELNSNELNKNILYLINEARTSPNQFYDHVICNDIKDKKIKKLSLFFKYFSKGISPLILDKNISICSQDLLTHLISIDEGKFPFNYTEEEKMRNSLKSRLKRLNLIPIHYNNFIIIGTDNSLDAIINLLLNEDYKNKILSPEMNLIGIASGLLPSENLCIIIDITHALMVDYNYRSMEKNVINKYDYYDNQREYENCKYNNDNNRYRYRYRYLNNYCSPLKNNRKNMDIKYNTNNNKWNSDLFINNTKKVYNSLMYSPYKNENINNYFSNNYKSYEIDNNEEGMDLKIIGQKTKNINNIDNITLYSPQEYKIPMSVFIDKQYIKDKEGKIIPIYTRETAYDDGSILIQPDIENYKDT